MPDVSAIDHDNRGGSPPRAPEAIAELADRQHGVVARRQLLERGVGIGAIQHRASTGGLRVLHSGVYAVGHRELRPQGRLMAAVLACGPGAVLSHHDAAWLWDLKPPSQTRVHVTVEGSTRPRRPGIVGHRVRALDAADRAVHEGIPVTSVPRTLLDLAEVLLPRQLERIVEEAERLRLFDRRAVEELRERNHGHHGLLRLGVVLGAEISDLATRSELETRFANLCSTEHLPAPALNAFIEGFEVDAAWPDQRVIVELDGYEFHRGRAAFERDRARDAALQVAGYRVLRITYRRLTTEPSRVAASVRELLAS